MSLSSQSTGFRSWGEAVRTSHDVAYPHSKDELAQLLATAQREGRGLLAVGLGRSYGDSCLNSSGALIVMTNLRRVIRFDRSEGVLRAEAGLSIRELIDLIVPNGFMLPVAPGTQYVTLGGAIANDVHGKNHHTAGTLGCHVRCFELLRADGSAVLVCPRQPEGLFAATIGGLGLTGIITWVELQLQPIKSSSMEVEEIAFADLSEFYSINKANATVWPYTVAWIDCTGSGNTLGRGIYSRGRHMSDGQFVARPRGREWKIPIEMPKVLLNKVTSRVFNAIYYAAHKRRSGMQCMHFASFLHPLDGVREWNRIYGHRGMFQYQLVVPFVDAEYAVGECLRQIAKAGEGSFLAVLKTFGARRSPGLLSFPMEGTTLALDFRNCGQSTLALLDRLDGVVCQAKGRLYPAKDGRMSAQMFRSGYPNIEQFKRHIDPVFHSNFWKRVCG